MEFPTEIPKPEYPMKVEHENNSITSEFEDGTVQSRRKFTRSRKTWTLKWNKLKQEYYEILEDFIVNKVHHAALAFNWDEPAAGKTYEVRCVSFEKELVTVNYWNVELKLQEK